MKENLGDQKGPETELWWKSRQNEVKGKLNMLPKTWNDGGSSLWLAVFPTGDKDEQENTGITPPTLRLMGCSTYSCYAMYGLVPLKQDNSK